MPRLEVKKFTLAELDSVTFTSSSAFIPTTTILTEGGEVQGSRVTVLNGTPVSLDSPHRIEEQLEFLVQPPTNG